MSESVKSKLPNSYHHGELKQALINAALELVAADGTPEAFTLRGAARLAGVSAAAPYRHFSDKQALLAAVAEDGYGLMCERMGAVEAANSDDPVARFAALGVEYVRFAIDQPAHFRVMFSALLVDKTPYPTLRSLARRAFDYLLRAIGDSQAAGRVRQDDAEAVALTAWAAVHGLAVLCVDGQVRLIVESGDIDSVLERVAEHLLHGLAVD